MEAGLRIITERLAVPAALLFATVPGGALSLVSAVGTWDDDAQALQGLAEALAGSTDQPPARGGVLDLDGATESVRFAAGAGLGRSEGALLVIAPDGRTPDDDWHRAFSDSAQLALGLIRGAAGSTTARLLHEVAAHPGPFEERLELALAMTADALGLNAAVFARINDQQWRPRAIFDPSGKLVPTVAVPLSDTFCALTVQGEGPVAVPDASAAPTVRSSVAAYLGAPVRVDGRCVGTISAVGPAPRPFSDDDQALVAALARWVGSALSGLETAWRLAAREADLSAFFDSAPMGMGIARLVEAADGADLEVVTVNASAAALIGSEPDALRGVRMSQAPVRSQVAADWLAACQRIRVSGRPERFDTSVDGRDGRHTLTTTVAPIVWHPAERGADRFTFVVENTTEVHRTADRAREREAQIEALVSQAPVALFATDRAGRLSMSRGRTLDLLGLSVEHSLGRSVADVFAHAPGAARAITDALEGHDTEWTAQAGDRTFHVQLRPRRTSTGQPAGLIGVALDTTDLAASAASAAPQARSALLKHLDREIRSPLTSILGYADLLSEHTPPGEVAEVRDVIGRSGERLLAALDDLLDLTLLDDDAITLHPTPVDPAAVVARVAEEGRAAAEARRLALNLWCTLPQEPVLIDARLFERVVRHLVSGAVAASTSARVDVSLGPSGSDGMELRVLSGPSSGGTSGGAWDQGIGPGLVHRLVRAMGGTSREVTGEAGGWTVWLPRHRVPVVRLAPASAPPAPTATPGPPAPDPGVSRGEAPAMDLRETAG